MSLIAGRGCRWPPRRDSVSPCAPLSGGRDTHDGHENSPILVFFSNLLGLHSGAVAVGDRCLLLPGASGSGKTTLTAWLVASGCQYLTDELTYLPQRSNYVEGFSQPLNVKTSGLGALSSYVTSDTQAAQILTTEAVALVPSDRLKRSNTQPTIARPRLAGIIFPTYKPGSPFSFTPLSRGRVGLRLMACVMNARNLVDHGFDQVAHIAGDVVGYEMDYSNLQQVEAHFDALRGALALP